jgi:uncharacterized protein (TIGR03435 family)
VSTYLMKQKNLCRSVIGALGVGVALIAGVGAQTSPAAQSEAKPTFEVVSIKANAPNGPGGGVLGVEPGGRFLANASLLNLMMTSFGGGRFLLPSQIDGPPWIKTETFTIVGKIVSDEPVDGKTSPALANLLRPFLEDRFKLRTHVESRPFPVYALVAAQADKPLGPLLHRSSIDCSTIESPRRDDARGTLSPPIAPQAILSATGVPLCGVRRNPGRLLAGSQTMAGLALLLIGAAGNTVVDRTGLVGKYDVDLTWNPLALGPTPTTSVSDGPSIFTALEEQLGLKLESRREPIDVIVIDHVERPTED